MRKEFENKPRSILPQSPVTWEIKERYSYTEIEKATDELADKVHLTEKGHNFVVISASDFSDENYITDMKAYMKKKVGNFSCCDFKQQSDQEGLMERCINTPHRVLDLDLGSRRFVQFACSDEHGEKIMEGIVEQLMAPVPKGTLIIDEGDDWDFINPPIFVVTK